MKRHAAFMLACLAMLTLLTASCSSGGDKNFIERMFDLESRSMKNAPPSSVEELRKAIAQYGGDVEKTVKAMEKVASFWRLLAVRYMEQGLYGDAYDAAVKALGHYPDNSGLYYVAGVSAAFLSKTASAELGGGAASMEAWLRAAEGSYLQSIEIDDRNTKSLYALSVLYSYELVDYEAAVSTIERYLAIVTRDADAYLLYGRSLYGAGRLQDAADAFDKVIAYTKIEEKKKLAADNKKQILDELYGK